MTYSLGQRRSARFAPARARARSGAGAVGGNPGATKSAGDRRDESAPELPILEAEVSGLRQLLAEVKANRDELRREMDGLRRDRDHWQQLAEQAGPTAPGGDGALGFAAAPRWAVDPRGRFSGGPGRAEIGRRCFQRIYGDSSLNSDFLPKAPATWAPGAGMQVILTRPVFANWHTITVIP